MDQRCRFEHTSVEELTVAEVPRLIEVGPFVLSRLTRASTMGLRLPASLPQEYHNLARSSAALLSLGVLSGRDIAVTQQK